MTIKISLLVQSSVRCSISRHKSSILDDPDLSPEHRQFLLDHRFPYSLVPEVVTESESQNSEISQVTRTDPPRSFDLTADTMANTELLKLLTDISAPLHMYGEILAWAKKHSSRGYDFITEQTSYGSIISHLQRTFDMSEYRPTQRRVFLPPLPKSEKPQVAVDITTFDFPVLLHSLLSDPELNHPDNLTIDPDHPFSEYPQFRLKKTTQEMEPIPLGEVHTAEWYHRTWASMVERTQDPESDFNKNFMIGIILYTDSTVLNIIGGLCCHPVNFTLTIFTEKCRRMSKAWRTLGFIPQKDAYEIRHTKVSNIANHGHVNNRRYHIMMKVITESLREAQHHRAFIDNDQYLTGSSFSSTYILHQ